MRRVFQWAEPVTAAGAVHAGAVEKLVRVRSEIVIRLRTGHQPLSDLIGAVADRRFEARAEFGIFLRKVFEFSRP